jgi:hypothetical protein
MSVLDKEAEALCVFGLSLWTFVFQPTLGIVEIWYLKVVLFSPPEIRNTFFFQDILEGRGSKPPFIKLLLSC